MRIIRAALFVAIACALSAQQPIAIGPANDGTMSGYGVTKFFDWYQGTPSGCVAGSGHCVGHTPQGDFYYWNGWLPSANGAGTPTPSQGLPVPTGLPIVGTFNDGHAGTCNGNVGLLQLDTWDFNNPNASHISIINCMASYSEGENTGARRWVWNNTSSDPAASVGDNSWKSRVMFSKGGYLYLPVERQIHAGGASVHDATIIVSPDSGAHWCNPYTFAYRSGGPGCDATNWQADGDAPYCVASGLSQPCTHDQYTDTSHGGAHSALMWKALGSSSSTPSLPTGAGGENWAVINPGMQDGQPYPSNMTGVFDPSVNTCFMLMPGDAAVACVPNASIMDISAWKYYYCPTLSEGSRCNPEDPANWTSNFALRTKPLYLGFTGTWQGGIFMNPYTLMFVKEFGSYLMLGYNNTAAWAPSPTGPWKQIHLGTTQLPSVNMIAPALGYTVLSTDPPHVQLGATSNTYEGGEGSPVFGLWDLVLGKNLTGENFHRTQMMEANLGLGFQFSDGHIKGSFPRRGLVHSFDLSDLQGWSLDSFPFFADANGKAVIVPCVVVVGPQICGQSQPSLGMNIELPNPGMRMVDTNDSYPGHLRIAPSSTDSRTGAVYHVTALEGNSSYSVIGLFRLDGFTASSRPGGMWGYGTPGGDNSYLGMDQTNGRITINWNAGGGPHYRFVSNFTFADFSTWYYIELTVAAGTVGCGSGSGCEPTAHLWVANLSTPGPLVDYLSGVSYTNTPSHNASTKTPNVQPGIFAIGINRETGNGFQSSLSIGALMIYSRDLSYLESKHAYNSMRTKMVLRGLVAAVVPDAPALTTNTQAVLAYMGKRAVGIAADGEKHPRALQTATTHYYGRTWGAAVTTGHARGVTLQ